MHPGLAAHLAQSSVVSAGWLLCGRKEVGIRRGQFAADGCHPEGAEESGIQRRLLAGENGDFFRAVVHLNVSKAVTHNLLDWIVLQGRALDK